MIDLSSSSSITEHYCEKFNATVFSVTQGTHPVYGFNIVTVTYAHDDQPDLVHSVVYRKE